MFSKLCMHAIPSLWYAILSCDTTLCYSCSLHALIRVAQLRPHSQAFSTIGIYMCCSGMYVRLGGKSLWCSMWLDKYVRHASGPSARRSAVRRQVVACQLGTYKLAI